MHLFSQGSEALTSQPNGTDGITCSIASGRSFRVKSSSTISPTPNNMKTSKTSTQLNIEDELTFSAEDSPANHSARQDFEKEQRTNATCGRRCLELSESVNPVGSWARTFGGLLVGRTDWYSKRVTLTWKLFGYSVQSFIIPACATGAPHRRDRVWIVANSDNSRTNERLRDNGIGEKENQGRQEQPFPEFREDSGNATNSDDTRRGDGHGQVQSTNGEVRQRNDRSEFSDSDSRNAPDSKRIRLEYTEKPRSLEECEGETRLDVAEPIETNGERGNAPDTDSGRCKRSIPTGVYDKQKREIRQDREAVKYISQDRDGVQFENFPTVPPICGGDDGLPEELDGITFSKWRRESIKAYGNAIVPQVAHRIFQSISDYESSKQIHK
jgi:site-specific DNA-cytosine methylase